MIRGMAAQTSARKDEWEICLKSKVVPNAISERVSNPFQRRIFRITWVTNLLIRLVLDSSACNGLGPVRCWVNKKIILKLLVKKIKRWFIGQSLICPCFLVGDWVSICLLKMRF